MRGPILNNKSRLVELLSENPPFDGEIALPVTPSQGQLLCSSDSLQWLAINIRIPFHQSVNDDVIQRAWNIVASQNDILRTYVKFVGDQYFLIIGEHVPDLFLADHCLDCCSDINYPHLIVKYTEGEPTLTFHVPQTLIDEDSIHLIEDDLTAAHTGAAPVPRDPFLNYATEVNSRDVLSASAHWKSVLAGAYPNRSIFPALMLEDAQVQKWSEVTINAGSALLARLDTFAEKVGVDRFTVLQATWAIVLAKHLAREDVIFSVTVRDRCSSVRNPSPIVGRMDITFPLRVQTSPKTSIIALLNLLKQGQSDGERFGYVGMDHILEQWDITCPFIYSALKVCRRGKDATHSVDDDNASLTLRIAFEESLRLTVRFDSALEEAKIRVVLDHCLAAIQFLLVSDPSSTTIGDVTLLSDSERRFLFDEAQPRTIARDALIHQLVEKYAARSPNSIVIEEFETGKTMSVGELNSLANIVARQLVCGPKSIIPICVERSTLLPVALLAVLKTGAAYVILDPGHPAERLRLILDDVRAPFILTSTNFLSLFQHNVKDISLLLDPRLSILDANIDVPLSSDHTAYVVYTSGSSGRPKGVVLTHGAASTGLLSSSPKANLRSLLFFNPVFSAAQRTIWATILHGGCLCVAFKESIMFDLETVITKMAVNTIGVTTSTASLLTPDDAPSLTTMTLTGEKVSKAVVDRWSDSVDLRSGYGLSECTQLNWMKRLWKGGRPNKIGRPTDSTSALILLPGLIELAPILVAGELCLTGPQLAQEYLNLPTLTDEVFIANPFGTGRLYRTGDQAIYHEDGSIEILGRIDRKVKVAGQRVDPSEIESILCQHRVIDSAAVVPITFGGSVTLIACLIFERGDWTREDMDSIRTHVVGLLPSFSVPSYWLSYAKLPTTVTGKVDFPYLQHELLTLGHDGLLSQSIFSSTDKANPVTSKEHKLRSLCARLLEVSEGLISMEDSFVAIGGSSLQAIQLCSELRKIGWSVTVTDIVRATSLKVLTDCFKSVAGGVHDITTTQPYSLVNRATIESDSVDWNAFEDVYPSSPFQEAVVAASLGGNTDYLYQRAYNVDGADINRLRTAFEQVLRRDPLLRTTFFPSNASILQGVLPVDYPFPWEEVESPLELYRDQDAARGIQPGKPFWRVAFLRHAQVLVVSSHHALFDFWSNSFHLDDTASCYYGYVPVARPAFNTFISHLLSSDQDRSRQFWKYYLQGAPPSNVNVPQLGNSVVERLVSLDSRAFQAAHSVTFGSLVYSAWAFVLSAHVGFDDVTFASELSGRDSAVDGVGLMNGPTLATAPLRIHITRDSSALQYVKDVNDNLWNMIQHSQYGLRGALHAADQTSRLFNTRVNIVMQKQPIPLTNGLFKTHGSPPIWKSEYITLEVSYDADRIKFCLVSALEGRRAHFIMEQFINTLAWLSEHPDQPLSELSFIGESEAEFLRSLATYPPVTKCLLHTSMEKVACDSPDRIALQWEADQSVPYHELNSRANRLAFLLRDKGVGPDTLVPLCIDKSIGMIVAIYAVLKAGGGYVPLDAENPPERNRFICKDVGAIVAVTMTKYTSIFDAISIPTFLIDTIDLSGPWPNPLHSDLTPDHLAYAIYTSGSTGMPKGVMITHNSAPSFVKARVEVERYKCDWRTLLFANYVFDVSAGDIFTVLSEGGTLCLAPMSSLLTNLAECINTAGANHISLTPTMARLLNPDDVPNLTHMLLGGEPMTADLVATFAPRLSLFNGYGPTETTIYVSLVEMEEGSNPRNIGKPFPMVGAFILEPHSLRPVPYGAIGELCVSGPFVARGYLNRPEVTEKSFVMREGERLYRSGDLVRWMPSGELECFGRLDNQVKIAGHRMELGEIENTITSTNGAKDNCVVVINVAGNRQLAAFVLIGIPDRDNKVSILPAGSFGNEIMSIKTLVGLSLPSYMVPKIWIPVSHVPLMPSSSKADRVLLTRLANGLSVLELAEYTVRETAEGPFVAPKTDLEHLHQSLWADILGVDKESIGATSSFFTFGGDSISAISLVSKCRRAGFRLDVGQVLAFPTLRDMASKTKALAASTGEQAAAYIPDDGLYRQLEAVGVGKADIASIMPAGPGQVEFLDLGEYNEKFWLLQTIRELPSDLDFDHWIDLTTRLTERNPILRSSFMRDVNGRWIQIGLTSCKPVLTEVDVADEAEMQAKVQEDWMRDFEIGQPGVRYCLLRLANNRRFLLFRLSHASYDGTCLRVLDSQFTSMARQEVPPEPADFRSFISYTEGLKRRELIDYWVKTLGDCTFLYPPSTARPVCNAVSMVKMDSSVDFYAPQCGVTVPIVYQTAFALLLSQLSGSNDVSYDNLVTGRDIPVEDTQLMSGACATFLPFRVRFDLTTPLSTLLKDTQSIFWDSNQHVHVPIMDIYRHLGKDFTTAQNKCLFLFQPFEPSSSSSTDHMRWCVMGLSKVRQEMNYGLMLEIFKTIGGYVLRLKYDNRIYTVADIEVIQKKLVDIVECMIKHPDAAVGVVLQAC